MEHTGVPWERRRGEGTTRGRRERSCRGHMGPWVTSAAELGAGVFPVHPQTRPHREGVGGGAVPWGSQFPPEHLETARGTVAGKIMNDDVAQTAE